MEFRKPPPQENRKTIKRRDCLKIEKDGVFEPEWGTHINEAIREAISLAAEQNRAIRFKFNDVIVTIHSDSDPKVIKRDLLRAIDGCIDKSVGPYPPSTIPKEERGIDNLIKSFDTRKTSQ